MVSCVTQSDFSIIIIIIRGLLKSICNYSFSTVHRYINNKQKNGWRGTRVLIVECRRLHTVLAAALYTGAYKNVTKVDAGVGG
jgi:hypothetical protein